MLVKLFPCRRAHQVFLQRRAIPTNPMSRRVSAAPATSGGGEFRPRVIPTDRWSLRACAAPVTSAIGAGTPKFASGGTATAGTTRGGPSATPTVRTTVADSVRRAVRRNGCGTTDYGSSGGSTAFLASRSVKWSRSKTVVAPSVDQRARLWWITATAPAGSAVSYVDGAIARSAGSGMTPRSSAR